MGNGCSCTSKNHLPVGIPQGASDLLHPANPHVPPDEDSLVLLPRPPHIPPPVTSLKDAISRFNDVLQLESFWKPGPFVPRPTRTTRTTRKKLQAYLQLLYHWNELVESLILILKVLNLPVWLQQEIDRRESSMGIVHREWMRWNSLLQEVENKAKEKDEFVQMNRIVQSRKSGRSDQYSLILDFAGVDSLVGRGVTATVLSKDILEVPEKPVSLCAVIGKYKTGKTYVLSRLNLGVPLSLEGEGYSTTTGLSVVQVEMDGVLVQLIDTAGYQAPIRMKEVTQKKQIDEKMNEMRDLLDSQRRDESFMIALLLGMCPVLIIVMDELSIQQQLLLEMVQSEMKRHPDRQVFVVHNYFKISQVEDALGRFNLAGKVLNTRSEPIMVRGVGQIEQLIENFAEGSKKYQMRHLFLGQSHTEAGAKNDLVFQHLRDEIVRNHAQGSAISFRDRLKRDGIEPIFARQKSELGDEGGNICRFVDEVFEMATENVAEDVFHHSNKTACDPSAPSNASFDVSCRSVFPMNDLGPLRDRYSDNLKVLEFAFPRFSRLVETEEESRRLSGKIVDLKEKFAVFCDFFKSMSMEDDLRVVVQTQTGDVRRPPQPYDARIQLEGFDDLVRGAKVEDLNENGAAFLVDEIRRVVSVIGWFKTGKTFILSRLGGKELRSGHLNVTEGFSMKLASSRDGLPLMLVDTAGFQSPIQKPAPGDARFGGVFQSRVEKKKADEMFVYRVLPNISHILIIVVTELTLQQQEFLLAYLRVISEMQNKPKVFVVHNLFRIPTFAEAEKRFRDDTEEMYPGEVKTHPQPFISADGGVKSVPIFVFRQDFAEGSLEVKHVMFGNDRSDSGSCNEAVLAYIEGQYRSCAADKAQSYVDLLVAGVNEALQADSTSSDTLDETTKTIRGSYKARVVLARKIEEDMEEEEGEEEDQDDVGEEDAPPTHEFLELTKSVRDDLPNLRRAGWTPVLTVTPKLIDLSELDDPPNRSYPRGKICVDHFLIEDGGRKRLVFQVDIPGISPHRLAVVRGGELGVNPFVEFENVRKKKEAKWIADMKTQYGKKGLRGDRLDFCCCVAFVRDLQVILHIRRKLYLDFGGAISGEQRFERPEWQGVRLNPAKYARDVEATQVLADSGIVYVIHTLKSEARALPSPDTVSRIRPPSQTVAAPSAPSLTGGVANSTTNYAEACCLELMRHGVGSNLPHPEPELKPIRRVVKHPFLVLENEEEDEEEEEYTVRRMLAV